MLLLLCATASAEDLTLHDAIVRALGSNLEIREARVEVRRADLDVSIARSAFQPSLGASSALSGSGDGDRSLSMSASLGQSLPSGGSASLSWDASDSGTGAGTRADGLSLTLSQPLLDGMGPWTALSGIRSAHRARDRERLAYRAQAEGLALQVSGAYWGLAAARETLDLARRSLAIAEQQLADTRERKDKGFAALGDVLQVERAVGVARQAVVVAEADLEAAQASLARLLGVRVEDRVPFTPVDQPVIPAGLLDLPSAIDRARLFNASYLQTRLLVEAAEDDLRLARNAALPALDLTGSLSRSGSGSSASRSLSSLTGAPTEWSVGLSMSTALFGRADRQEARRQALALSWWRLALDAADQDLALDVEAAVREVRRDRSRLDLARQTVQVAEAALLADQELLRAGRGSSREVVRSLEALDAANVSRLQAEIDLQASHLGLLGIEGLLLESLGVALP